MCTEATPIGPRTAVFRVIDDDKYYVALFSRKTPKQDIVDLTDVDAYEPLNASTVVRGVQDGVSRDGGNAFRVVGTGLIADHLDAVDVEEALVFLKRLLREKSLYELFYISCIFGHISRRISVTEDSHIDTVG